MTPPNEPLRADVVLPMAAEEACARLRARLHGGLDLPGDAAVVPVRLLVGPSPHLPQKKVEGQMLAPHQEGPTTVFPLHWAPVGATAAAFPTLDARVGLTPIDETSCLLSIAARHTPPFGHLGAAADRAGLSHVAEATVHSVLRRLAHTLLHSPAGGA